MNDPLIEKVDLRREDPEATTDVIVIRADDAAPPSGLILFTKGAKRYRMCNKCNLRPAIKTGSNGYECQACASGIDPTPHRKPLEPGRNEPCPCASGKKYKRCCGGKANGG